MINLKIVPSFLLLSGAEIRLEILMKLGILSLLLLLLLPLSEI